MSQLINRYPVGVQSFVDIRSRDLVYVDKTSYIWDLAHQGGKAFFLSRPRRFGKSLLVSTMQAYFEGRRELFKGLAIEKLETDWKSSPVIRLDMSTAKAQDPKGLQGHLDSIMSDIEARFGVERSSDTPGARLRMLITRMRAETGRRVVVLVDEYDAPLLNTFGDSDQIDDIRQIMREFFIPLKACDEDLRFVFLTGITKFSQLSIFSELNNLRNISMEPAYAAICGISEKELRGQLTPDVEALAGKLGIDAKSALAFLKTQYDGYHFCFPSPDIYNPFSLLCAFAKGDVGSWWFETGTPAFLVRMIRSRGWQIPDLVERDVMASQFDAPAESPSSLIALLYQSGYLTIKAFDPESRVYTLGIPNREVSLGLAEGLVSAASPEALDTHNSFLIGLARSLRSGDADGALQLMRSYLAGIPYHLGSRDERGFETAFYLIFDLLGIQIETEFKTASGRVDAVVRTADAVYVMEFKYGKTAADALAQIDAKGYCVPFERDGRRLVKIGVNFSPGERTIDDWIIQEA